MQNFPNSPAPPPPGFPSRAGNMVGSPYPSHMSDPQISPRTTEDYAAMQQAQPHLQSHGQHLHLRGQQQVQTSSIHGYGPRRGAGEIPQATAHSASSSSLYRKESMDYYFPMSGRDRSRRGGGAYGAGFGYPNMDGHIAHQYRHASGSGSSSGMVSPYPMDYSTTAASGSGSGSSSGSGSFSPSQQFSMAQNASMQTASGAEILQRQHGSKYPSHQGLHQGHRAFSLSGHRIPSQFGHYPTLNAPTVPAGMYNSPPQRYETSSSGSMDSKINNSPSHPNPNSSAASNSSGHQENVGQTYQSSNHPPYSPQSLPAHKHASRRTAQQSVGAGYDAALKMQHGPQSLAHSKNPQSSVSSSPAASHLTPQDLSKSPMHTQNQQTHMSQNFSPISNPSPAPSAVHSPSCSSSSSPLMGVSEGLGNTTSTHCSSSQPPSHASLLNPRSSHSNVRASHAIAQLSPTPSSNSSISSCGSSAGSKVAGLNPNIASSAMNQNRMGMGARGGQRDEGSSSMYPTEKLSQDSGMNSLNALTSQVANLPNTVQHMLLTDTVLSHKKSRENAHLQQPAANQQKNRNASTAGMIAANEESGDVLGSEIEDTRRDLGEPSEREKMRQIVGSSTESKPANYYQAPQIQTQTQMGPNRHGLHLQMDRITEASVKQSFSQVSTPCSQTKTPEIQTPSSSSPSSVPPFTEPSPNTLSCPPAPSAPSSSTSSPTNSTRSNCIADPDIGNSDDKSGLRDKMSSSVKDERCTVEQEEHVHQEEHKVKHTLDMVSVKVEPSSSIKQNKNDKDDEKSSIRHFHSKLSNTSEQSNVGVVGVIVSTRSEQNPEGTKQTEATSPHYGPSYHLGKLSYSEEKHSINMFRDSGSHNGEGEMGIEAYTAHYDVSPKTEFGQSMSSNHCHPGSYKYGSPEVPYNACMGGKNKGRTGQPSAVGANRFQDYSHSQYNFASIPRKDAGVLGVVGRSGVGVGSRSQDSQLQQPFPSLLQEVLQGYHLDRRYGRPEQASSALLQAKNMPQPHYHTRLPYRMIENMRSHGVGQSVMAGASVHHPMASGKPHTQNQSQGPPDLELGPNLHPSWESEAQRPKGDHGMLLEKAATSMSPNYSAHIQPSDSSVETPPKHINLADYSLPHRKPPNLATPPSAVQQLLLQETDSIAVNVENLSQTQSQASSSSGRRSVICDVSPSRRTTPERDRGASGPSVIQQPVSSSVLNEQGCSKDDVKDIKDQEPEESKINPNDSAKPPVKAHSAELDKEEPSKTLHAPVDVNSDLQRNSGGKGNNELTSNSSYHSQHHVSAETLTSPHRRKPFSKAVDGSGFAAYGFSDTVDGSKVNTHHQSNNPFHALSSPSHIPSPANKMQAYPHSLSLQHPHSLDDRFDWSASSTRPKDITIHQNSAQNSDQKCKIQSPTDVLPNQHHLSRQHSYPGAHYDPSSHYDMKMWESFAERDGAGGQQLHSVSQKTNEELQAVSTTGPKLPEADISRGITEESTKTAAASAVGSGATNSSNMAPGTRPTKTGGSSETNPLMMRRRVRSFISPIPAKRQHQDFSSQRSGSSYNSPAPHSESRQLNDSDSPSVDARPKVASSNVPYQAPSTNLPSQGKTKILPPRKGRGLKLEAIVQKITPNKKSSYNSSHVDADYPDVSHYSSDISDPEIGAPFSSAPHREGGSLPYLEDSHSLDELLPYRAEDAYSCDSQVLQQSATTSTSSTLRNLPTDFDFGLGTAGSSTGPGTGDDNKDEFTLLGPLPPPPPLPRPVQGSPPPSSSVLSDIQQFTNTYQQLETRRGEQSAANLLRQKLQESGMGFDDYGGGDFYGATSPHSQSPGHHILSRGQQVGSNRMSSSDPKASDSIVPKGYFPSGKKKGRPVGSVNKQKRAQVQNTSASLPAAPQTPPAAGSSTPPTAPTSSTAGEVITVSDIPEQKPCPSVDLDPQVLPVKVDIESEDNQTEVDLKPVKPRQKKGKEGSEGNGPKGKQWKAKRGLTPKQELDTQAGSGVNASLTGVLQDARKNVFAPYIHVERKVAEIGAVCTIVNSEEEKSKGGGKGAGSAVDGPSNVSQTSQTVRKEKEIERMQEKGIVEQTDSGQSGKSIPTSGYVLSGPVVSETGHTGRFLCCLCQKWANYKNLGDLYGPFYPADYAAKIPKNQPQVRQILSNSGAVNAGPNLTSVSTEAAATDSQSLHPQDVKSADSDCTASQTTNPTSPATTIGTESPAVGEDMPCLGAKMTGDYSKTPAQNWDLTSEVEPVALKPPDLEIELAQSQQQKVEDLQQRPQHRKLTSHPRFKRRHKSSEELPRTIPINSKASLPFQPPPPSLDSLGPLAQLAQLPLVPLDPEELWVHESCIVWTSGVYLVNGRLYGLQEALDGARDTSCSHCEMAGSTLGCYSKGCTLRYHYLCAVEADCYLNEDNFSLRCPKHKSPPNSRPVKPAAAYLEQSERG
ncbi:transcription factor 20 [Astyanax mexicanus]|uniref:transcription factor 20 n=1 Tax=Astyanax mexicanus TaxID=7994 RepID=UPI0020CB4048|nr:transcription factor 20 [Astyanax mexicanus]XP_049331721.1 transcription factor 20 [Astyanax mexicanus]XP_049331722.1 transcription factor 20 [Astyanax mexicanus]